MMLFDDRVDRPPPRGGFGAGGPGRERRRGCREGGLLSVGRGGGGGGSQLVPQAEI